MRKDGRRRGGKEERRRERARKKGRHGREDNTRKIARKEGGRGKVSVDEHKSQKLEIQAERNKKSVEVGLKCSR